MTSSNHVDFRSVGCHFGCQFLVFPHGRTYRLGRCACRRRVSVVARALLGLVPALQSTRPDVAGALRGENAGGGQPGQLPWRNPLVVTQLTMSLVLLVGAGSPSLGRKWVEGIIGDATDWTNSTRQARLDDHAERKRRGEWPYGVVVGSSGRPSNIKITVGAGGRPDPAAGTSFTGSGWRSTPSGRRSCSSNRKRRRKAP